MSCADIERRVALYAGGDLDDASARDVERHLATCETCVALFAALRVQREAMAESRATAPSQADLDEVRSGVLAAIARGDARPGSLDRLRFEPFRSVVWGSAGLAAAALLVFAVWAMMWNPQDVEPSRRAAAVPLRVESQAAAAVTPPRAAAAAPAQVGRTADAGRDPIAGSTPSTVAARRPSATRPRQEPTEMGTAGASPASGSRGIVAEIRNAVEISHAPAGPMRRIEFQTADPSIRIIWLLPEQAPNPDRPESPVRRSADSR